ncbi:MAG: sulfatase-like hydrolase/transferase [Planctomycetota bacterium]
MRARAARLLALLLGAACGGGDERPSVLFVTIDTLRADAVSAWGVETDTTPVLDGLAASGVRFAHASSVAPITLPTHATIFTGARPADHGLTVNGVMVPRLPVKPLAQRLAEQGYATGAFVSSTVLDHRFGLGAGFAHYDDDLVEPGGPTVPTERRGDRTVDRALAWDGWDAEPFFAWVHLFDPHAPYAAPGGRAGTDRAAYLDEVRFADAQLGRLLEGVREARDGPVLVVVVSDHGEGLGEHGEETHSLLLHETTMHVPWVMAWLDADAPRDRPALAASVRDDAVSVMDVAPTVLDVLGMFPSLGSEGLSVLEPQLDRPLPMETRAPWFYYGFSSLSGVRYGDSKLVGAIDAEDPNWTFSRPEEDPSEKEAVRLADHPLRGLVRFTTPKAEAVPGIPAEDLAALGYFGNEPLPTVDGALEDPRQHMELIEGLNRVNLLMAKGKAPEAEAEAIELRGRYGDVPELLYIQGRLALGRGDWRTAIDELRRAVAHRPTAALNIELAAALLRGVEAGEIDPAEPARHLDLAMALAPGDPRAIGLRAVTDVLAGRPEDGLARVERSLAGRPHDANLLGARLRALVALGRTDEAREVEELMRELWPQLQAPR